MAHHGLGSSPDGLVYPLTMARSEASWWRRFDPGQVRELITETNDGIMAVAGMGLGLAGAGIPLFTSYAVVTISAVAGALSIFGTKVGEAFAEREAELATQAEEQGLLELSPDEEIAELAEWFVCKGVSPQTSRQVAEELSASDALSVQLQLEHGIEAITTASAAWASGIRSGSAFLIGAMIPLLVTMATPAVWREGYTIITAAGALILTSVILAALGRAKIWSTLLRTLGIGLGTLAISYLLGDWLL